MSLVVYMYLGNKSESLIKRRKVDDVSFELITS